MRTALLPAFALLLLGCPDRPRVQTERDDAPSDAGQQAAALEGFSTDDQSVGAPTDGMTLQEVRVGTHEGFRRVVFAFDGDQVPAATARLEGEAPILVVAIDGVRDDVTGNRPLTNEMGEPFGSPVTVDAPPLTAYGRRLVLDDSQVAYEIRLTRRAPFRLHALEGPPRIVVDVAAD